MKGRTIIISVCEQYGVTPAELAQPRRGNRNLSAARREMIRRLRDAKFSIRNIARLSGCSYSSVIYHIYPKRRATVLRAVRKHSERRAA